MLLFDLWLRFLAQMTAMDLHIGDAVEGPLAKDALPLVGRIFLLLLHLIGKEDCCLNNVL